MKVTSGQFSKAFSSLVGQPILPMSGIGDQLDYAARSSIHFSLPWDSGDISIYEEKFQVVGDGINPKPSCKLRKLVDQNTDMLHLCFDGFLPLKQGMFVCGYVTDEEIVNILRNYSKTMKGLFMINKGLMLCDLGNFVTREAL